MGGQLHTRRDDLFALASRQHGVVSRAQLLEVGLTPRMIERRLQSGRLRRLYRGVYAVGHRQATMRSRWMAALLALGPGATLSHRSAASLWKLLRPRPAPIEATVGVRGRRGPAGVSLHLGRPHPAERTSFAGIPVTTVPRTLLDLAEVVEPRALERAFEEADRLRLLKLPELERVCARAFGRRGLKPLRRLIDAERGPPTRSPLEDMVLALCREYGIPAPDTNIEVLGCEVDAVWPDAKVMVEADGFAFHSHRAAFERDRSRDIGMQIDGYRVARLTHKRITEEPAEVAAELRSLLELGRRAGA